MWGRCVYRWVISVGGRDQSVFQWQVVREAEPEATLLTAPNEVEVYYAPQRKLIIVRAVRCLLRFPARRPCRGHGCL